MEIKQNDQFIMSGIGMTLFQPETKGAGEVSSE